MASARPYMIVFVRFVAAAALATIVSWVPVPDGIALLPGGLSFVLFAAAMLGWRQGTLSHLSPRHFVLSAVGLATLVVFFLFLAVCFYESPAAAIFLRPSYAVGLLPIPGDGPFFALAVWILVAVSALCASAALLAALLVSLRDTLQSRN